VPLSPVTFLLTSPLTYKVADAPSKVNASLDR
jgi:hypothetical protein